MTASENVRPLAIVTGANTGIGRVTAIELAKQGYRVVLACRSREKTDPVVAEIRQAYGEHSALFEALDLSDLSSVAKFASRMKDETIELLINNAGLAGSQGITKDGFEITFGTNHLGHFALTLPLLPALLRAKAPRVVNVSSRSHYQVKKIDYSGVQGKTRTTTGLPEYSLSKLANVWFTAELHRRYASRGLKAYSLHPGVVATDIWRSIPWPFRGIGKWFMISNEEGAQTTLHCATNPHAESGLYYDKSKPKTPSAFALDGELAKDLWARSEAWTGVHTEAL
jgi:retinol dehydrogenase 12